MRVARLLAKAKLAPLISALHQRGTSLTCTTTAIDFSVSRASPSHWDENDDSRVRSFLEAPSGAKRWPLRLATLAPIAFRHLAGQLLPDSRDGRG
jgi:hypothetical protein